jgi:diacylglycerol kinase
MTRMKRIYADFYHAFGAIRINFATKAESHEETILIQPALSFGFFVAKNFAAGKAKSA